MGSTQYISVRETAQLLEISENKVVELIETRKLQAYRIANRFLRLKKSDVLSLRNSGKVTKQNGSYEYTAQEKFIDFLYFNDFYLVALGVIAALLYVVFFT